MKISVVIVTKNRKKVLARCLTSLRKQTLAPDELIVIDNNSADGTRSYLKNFMKLVPFKIRCVVEKRNGYPVIYNRGIKESSFPWIIFIDDDCIAKPTWLEEAKKSIVRHPGAAAILGESTTVHINNIFSLATWFIIYRWKHTAMQNTKVIDCEILDNKNIAYNKLFLTEHDLKYDESRVSWLYGAAEDADLGMQIWQAGGSAFFAPNMTVAHEDPTSLTHYIKKINNSILSVVSYEHKWKRQRRTIEGRLPKKKFISMFFAFRTQYRITLLFLIPVFFLLCATYVYTRFYYRYARSVYLSHSLVS